MNVVALTGRTTAEIELKKTQNGTSVCSFCIAVNRPRVKDTTDFINCVAWRHTAEFIAQYFRKGDKIGITGILTSRKYQDQNGNNRTAFEVVVDNVEFGESKKTGESAPEAASNYEELAITEDLPF